MPKDQKLGGIGLDSSRNHNLASLSGTPALSKKRKLGQRESMGYGSDGIDMKLAMGMAMDMGLAGEDEGEELLTMSDEQMVCFISRIAKKSSD